MSDTTERAPVKVPPPFVFLTFAAVALLLNWVLPVPTPMANSFRIAGLC
jgi:hypothetical protein